MFFLHQWLISLAFSSRFPTIICSLFFILRAITSAHAKLFVVINLVVFIQGVWVGMDILPIQETNQKQCFEVKLEHYIFLNSGNEERILGVRFLISRRLKERIRKFASISERSCRMQIKSKYRNMKDTLVRVRINDLCLKASEHSSN